MSLENIQDLVQNNRNLLPDDVDFARYFQQSKHSTIIVQGSHFIEETKQRIANSHARIGATLPFQKTHDDLLFNSGVSVWAGINGHGKSTMLFQICIGLQKQGHTVCIASVEMEGSEILKTMTNQAAGCKASPDFAETYANWAGERLQIYNASGETRQEDMLGAIIWAADNRNVTHFVVDNLMMLTDGDIGERAMNSQKYFVSRCKDIARDKKIHIHIVHHMRKIEDERKVPSKMDVMGGISISNLVDYLFIVWKNKDRARHMAVPERFRTSNPELEQMPGAYLICDKNRSTGVERTYGLWFDTDAQQFLDGIKKRPTPMIENTPENL